MYMILSSTMQFLSREDAGKRLANELKDYTDNALILAIPNGGVAIGRVVADELHLPLDIVLTKKIGHPHDEEFAIGAVSTRHVVLDEVEGVDKAYVDHTIKRLQKQLQERYHQFKKEAPLPLEGKTVIIVDDGIATGNTVMVAVHVAKDAKAKKVIVATPVGPKESLMRLHVEADDVICLHCPENFMAVAQFYKEFQHVTDKEVKELLAQDL